MDTKTALKSIQEKGFVFNIGQFEPQAKKDLETLVRKGKLGKTTAYWPDLYSGIAKKTIYGWPAGIRKLARDRQLRRDSGRKA